MEVLNVSTDDDAAQNLLRLRVTATAQELADGFHLDIDQAQAIVEIEVNDVLQQSD